MVELGVLALVLLLAYLGLQGCAGCLTERAIDALPPSVDATVGKAGAEQMRAKYGAAGGAEPPAAARQRVERIFAELLDALSAEQAAALDNPRVTLVADEQVNAFALPGGEVFVLIGLLARVGDDDALLRGVLAHELGHAVRRHGLRSLARNAAVSMAVGWLLGDVDELTASLVAGAAQLDELSYSRDMETEADDFGFELLRRGGHDPEGLARFLESLESAPVPQLLSTHPDSRQRAAAIRRRLQAEP